MDVVALGELLIDFTENGISSQGNPLFEANPGADMMLTEEEIPEELILETRIFHFGTLSMTHEKVRRATKKAVAIAKQLVRSFHLILIYVSHCGIQWMRQESRYCMVWDSVIS